jgi:AAA family ATP:ADP antiporter
MGWLLSRLGLSRDEFARTVPITLAYGLLLASLYLLKPARNALFLESQGIAELPFVLVMVAVIGGLTTALYGNYAKTVRIDRLIRITFIGMIGMLFGFRFLLTTGWGWVVYAFYIWVALYGLLSTSLIWLLANAMFTSRQARKVFGYIGTGGIAGAIVGGAFTGSAAKIIGTQNLLFVCAAIIVLVLGLLKSSKPQEQAPRASKRKPKDGLSAILQSPLLVNLAITAGLIAMVAVIVDIQFNEIVDRTYANTDDKTAFFGAFFAYLSGFGFLFQLILTPLILRSFGVGVAILILPVAMGLGSGAILLAPGLIAAMIAKGADGGFRHSIHKAASEVLFLPVPPEQKNQAKLLLDTSVDTAATGLGAMLVLLLTGPMGLGHDKLSYISVPLVIIVVFVALRMRRAYVDAFRRALEGRQIDLEALRVNLDEAGVIGAILPALESENERQILYALQLLSSVRAKALFEPLQRLLTHSSAEVRTSALKVLQEQANAPANHLLEPLLADADESVRLEAMVLICDEKRGSGILQKYLDSDNPTLTVAALGVVFRRGPEAAETLLSIELVQSILSAAEANAELKPALARALAGTQTPELLSAFWTLAKDDAPSVVRAAVEGLGKNRCSESTDWLLDCLADRRLRRAARQALAQCGAPAVAALATALSDPNRPVAARQLLPRVLGEISRQEALDALLANLSRADPQQKHLCIRALARLHANHPDFVLAKEQVFEAIEGEARAVYRVRQELLALGTGPDTAAHALLIQALKEREARCVGDIFLLMGLRYDPQDMNRAYVGIISKTPRVRASALEFLDNLLKKRIRGLLLPIVEPSDPADFKARAAELLGVRIDTRKDALVQLLEGDDPWLTACTLFVLDPQERQGLSAQLDRAAKDPRALVREAAERVCYSEPSPC